MIQRAFPAASRRRTICRPASVRETPFRMWRDKVVSIEHREIEKFSRDFHADRMQARYPPARCGKNRPGKIRSSDRDNNISAQFPEHSSAW